MKRLKIVGILTILITTVFMSGCRAISSSYSNSAQITRDTIVCWRDGDIAYWKSVLEDRSIEFEKEIVEFRANVLIEAEQLGILDADGVISLNQRETELRTAFEQNLDIQLEKLQSRIESYDTLIILQEEMITTSEDLKSLQIDAENAVTTILSGLHGPVSGTKMLTIEEALKIVRDRLSNPDVEENVPIVDILSIPQL